MLSRWRRCRTRSVSSELFGTRVRDRIFERGRLQHGIEIDRLLGRMDDQHCLDCEAQSLSEF
jgi:hypothetical protein